jgi:magnesium-transporting ATPase (P-type)
MFTQFSYSSFVIIFIVVSEILKFMSEIIYRMNPRNEVEYGRKSTFFSPEITTFSLLSMASMAFDLSFQLLFSFRSSRRASFRKPKKSPFWLFGYLDSFFAS